jgi:hypothetical protein
MKLLDKHITYENDCRQMFLGQTIRSVIYGELKYSADEEGNNNNPEPYYVNITNKLYAMYHIYLSKYRRETLR